MKKIVLMTLGFIALVFGAVGLCLPIWPTTPFVLIAAGCFGASSEKLYARLESSRAFGEYVRNYRHKTGISRRARIRGIAFLWGSLLISALVVRQPHMWIVLGIVGTVVTLHLLTIRRGKPVDVLNERQDAEAIEADAREMEAEVTYEAANILPFRRKSG
jgi:uncharacterized membrane protein YbaN (DUF454 family)